MALLELRAGGGALLLLLLGGCAEDGRNGIGTVDIYERPVVCDAEQRACTDPRLPGVPVDPDDPQRSGLSFVSRAASQYGENGIYLYLELQRAGGVTAAVELDLPTTGAVPEGPIHAVYQERSDGRLLFSSRSRAGRIDLPASPECPCQDILLELDFTDPGPDGILGSADDLRRRLSRGVVAASQALCLAPRLLAITEGTIEVGRSCHALPASSPPPSTSGGSSSGGGSSDLEVGCAADPSYEDDTGCDSGSDSDYDESSGCDGGGDYSDSSSGCDGGDGGSDWGGSSGCDGDSAGSASCEGDALAALGRGSRGAGPRRPPFRARLLGTILPFALFGLFTAVLRRRSRRR